MNALEKAARAAFEAYNARTPIRGAWEEQPDFAKAIAFEQARAVLMAVREPDGCVTQAGMAVEFEGGGWMESTLDYDNKGSDALKAAFTAMIDAILADQTQEGPPQ